MKALGVLSTLLVVGPPLLGFGAQIPFHAIADQATIAEVSGERWNFNIAPSPNATENYIFETVASLLQQWPNTRYRNGTPEHSMTRMSSITLKPL